MFGYVVINKPDIRFKDYDIYQAYYCGLCRELKAKYGLKGQITLNYDLTFLTILLSSLYEPEHEIKSMCKCIAHPFEKHRTIRNEFSSYAADMNVLLSYYKCLDDINDEHSFKAQMLGSALKKSGKSVERKYPKQAASIKEELQKLSEYESSKCTDIDAVSGCFGRLLAAVFVYREDEWKEYLYEMGFYLGKFIYILDAYADYNEDIKSGRYNPLSETESNLDGVRNMLTLEMAECAKAYEMLPIVDNTDIIENIIYSGIWSGFGSVN